MGGQLRPDLFTVRREFFRLLRVLHDTRWTRQVTLDPCYWLYLVSQIPNVQRPVQEIRAVQKRIAHQLGMGTPKGSKQRKAALNRVVRRRDVAARAEPVDALEHVGECLYHLRDCCTSETLAATLEQHLGPERAQQLMAMPGLMHALQQAVSEPQARYHGKPGSQWPGTHSGHARRVLAAIRSGIKRKVTPASLKRQGRRKRTEHGVSVDLNALAELEGRDLNAEFETWHRQHRGG